jgi:hypothetical protein
MATTRESCSDTPTPVKQYLKDGQAVAHRLGELWEAGRRARLRGAGVFNLQKFGDQAVWCGNG